MISELGRHLKRASWQNRRKRICEAISYPSSFSDWLSKWRSAPSTTDEDRSPGAIEGKVGKLLSDSFKKRGMSWRPSGADHMCQIIELREIGELRNSVSKKRKTDEKAAEAAMASLKKEVRRSLEAWIRKNMPLLRSKSLDSWVKDVLMGLAGYGKMAC